MRSITKYISGGLQIHDSNLYTVSGDVSLMIQNSQFHDSHLSIPAPSESLELEAGWSVGTGCEISRATRNVRGQSHGIVVRHTPYNMSFRPCPSITGSTEQNPSSSSLPSFSAPALDLSSHFTSPIQMQTSLPIILPPFGFGVPPSGPQLTRPSDYLPRINQEDLHHISTPSSRYQYESAPSNPQPTGTVEHPHSHDHAYLTDFTTPSPWDYKYGGGKDQERQYHHVDPPRSIHGGTFITAQNVHQQHGEVGIHILSRGIALDAL
ncbi:hypothetical protein B0H14DRAFT_2443058 [Mycena olivaceomarginata]|nr:hypothetical protein B0H14DRAFT_2443058 [Mycena olivaceomarginata]